MSKARYRHIDKVLLELRAKYPDLNNPPVDLGTLLKRLKIDLIKDDFGTTLSGAAIIDGAKRIISVNKVENPMRQRFTVAHELGHLLLHQDQAINIDVKPLRLLRDRASSAGESWREIEANYFAASLLMPKDLVLEKFAAIFLDDDEEKVVENLAREFKVSSQAMNIRLASLDLMIF